MASRRKTPEEWASEVEDLRARLVKAEDTLLVYRNREAEVLATTSSVGKKAYALAGGDHTYRMLVESMQQGAATLLEDGRILYGNQYLAQMLKTPSQDLIGTDVQTFVHPADAPLLGTLLHEARQAKSEGELRLRAADGTLIPAYLAFNSLELGKAKCLCVAVTDMTASKAAAEALRESEDKFRYVFDYSTIGKSITLPSGEMHVNATFCQMLGYSREELVDRKWQEVTHADDAAETQQHMNSILSGASDSARFTQRLIHKDGSVVWADVCTSLRRGQNGQPLYFMTAVSDITERKRVEEALQLAGAYNRSLIEASLDPLVTIGLDGKITDVNVATETVTGSSRHALIGTDFSDYFTDPDKARAGYQQAFREGFVRDYSLELRHRDGHIRSVIYNASVYRGPGGRIAGLFAAARDITQRKLAEEALQLAGAYNRSLIEASLDPLVTIGADGKITDVNAATEVVTGSSRSALIGTDFCEYFTDPDKARAGYQQAFRDGFVRDYPLELRHCDGHVTSVIYNASVYRDSAGNVAGVFAAARDITERKRAEEEAQLAHEHLRRFVDANIVGVLIVKSGGIVLEANDYYLNLVGFTREELQRGQVDWRAVTPPEWLSTDEEAIRELRERGTCAPYEKEYLRRDGTRVPVLLADAMLPGPGEQIAAFALDLSDRKEAEREIRKLNAELEQRVRDRTAQLEAANRELEAFSYSVSHDLRAPLRAVEGYADILLEDHLDRLNKDGQFMLQQVRKSALNMEQLINDLLAFSRMGRREKETVRVDMRALVREVCDELLATHPDRQLEFRTADLPAVYGDKDMLRQVWRNLLGNAVKFTRPRAVAEIEVGYGGRKPCELSGESSECGQSPSSCLTYFVRDNGVGFEMAYKNKLFGVFQRLHSIRDYEGTGVGLALVKRVVDRHGGEVWAEGKVDQGATFYFTLRDEPQAEHGATDSRSD